MKEPARVPGERLSVRAVIRKEPGLKLEYRLSAAQNSQILFSLETVPLSLLTDTYESISPYTDTEDAASAAEGIPTAASKAAMAVSDFLNLFSFDLLASSLTDNLSL